MRMLCILGIALIIVASLQISFFSVGDLGFVMVVLLAFFDQKRNAQWFGCALGFTVDLFSPLFGVHTLLYPAVALAAQVISERIFTNRSLFALQILILILYCVYRSIEWGILFFTHLMFHSLTPFSSITVLGFGAFFAALLVHALLALLVFFIVARRRAGNVYMELSI